MADHARKLREDRALRKAARALVTSDIAFIRDGVQQRSIPQRIGARLGGSARDIAGEAAELAKENRTAIGAGLAVGAAGLLAWLFRGQIKAGAEKLLDRIQAPSGDDTGGEADDT